MATRTYEERKQIQAMWEKGASVREIGEAIRAPGFSVIYAGVWKRKNANLLPISSIFYPCAPKSPMVSYKT